MLEANAQQMEQDREIIAELRRQVAGRGPSPSDMMED